MGDMNAKIGKRNDNHRVKGVVGKYGLGAHNERGERMLHFAIENRLM